MKYNYYEAVKEDIKLYLEENYTTEELAEELKDFDGFYSELSDTLWIGDSVTGNASGSYYFNTWRAEEAICHNLDLLAEALKEFGCDVDVLEKGAEWCDVTIRCYLVNSVLYEVLQEIEDEISERA